MMASMDFDQLLSDATDELNRVLPGGAEPPLDEHLPVLLAASEQFEPRDPFEETLGFVAQGILAGCTVLGDTQAGRTAGKLFGVTEGSIGALLGERQSLASVEIPMSTRHFRRPNSAQQKTIARLAEAIASTLSFESGSGHSRARLEQIVRVREANEGDREFVTGLMESALSPYYGGDHAAHADRILSTHLEGGFDALGFFSTEQKMFIATLGDEPDAPQIGMIHVVAKRQRTFKISPLIVDRRTRGRLRVGTLLLQHAEQYAREEGARQMYCTVARENVAASRFFRAKGFVSAGQSASHYKADITEEMLYKILRMPDNVSMFDRPNISVTPFEPKHEAQVRRLLIETLSPHFMGIDDSWVDALFAGHARREEADVNKKFKLIFVATDRQDKVLGVAGATPKKGEPIKIMPLIATTPPAFAALIMDIPFELSKYGHKLYTHISPTTEEIELLQASGWKHDADLPEAYMDGVTTQQWSVDVKKGEQMRTLRLKQRYLNLVKSGTKPLEVRVGYDSIKEIQSGDRIRFASRDDEQVVLVRDVRNYSNFAEMAASEKLSEIVPGQSEAQVLRTLSEIYPPKKEKLGIVVLAIEPTETT